MPEVEKFGVAIAGLGTVGSGVAQILSESRSGELGLFLKSILEREPEKGPASEWYQKIPKAFVKNHETILEDPEIRNWNFRGRTCSCYPNFNPKKIKEF